MITTNTANAMRALATGTAFMGMLTGSALLVHGGVESLAASSSTRTAGARKLMTGEMVFGTGVAMAGALALTSSAKSPLIIGGGLALAGSALLAHGFTQLAGS